MVARQFPSQNIWKVLLWYEIYQKARLRPGVLIKTERMRLQTHRNFMVPNHPLRLAARVTRSPIWQRWIKAVGIVQSQALVDSVELSGATRGR
jgi:hypothetical protein